MNFPTAIALVVAVLPIFISQGLAKRVKCGKDRIDDETNVCCNGVKHVKAWGSETECCGQYAYNPLYESCCNGLVNPGYGDDNSDGECCGDYGYDRRCYECSRYRKNSTIKPLFNFRSEVCCDGNVNKLLPRKTCCCGNKVFDPTDYVCCENKIIDRPDDMPGDCCNCGLTLVDLVFVLDSSESITSPNWPKMLKFTTDILEEAEINDDNVRVGLVTYRHNVTTNFYLDDHHKKKEMFADILQTDYVRGSTNTGAGLETMRREVFDSTRGDRRNVDNVCIVITDGDSDDRAYTIEQARLAKEAGIHIFAIGIHLKSTEELEAIASPPAEANVLSIDDFENLESLRGRIFASICTGQPIVSVFEPCGDKFFNPANEVCCDGNPQPMYDQGEETPCCAEFSYDNSKSICCRDIVRDRKAGKKTECCADKALDPVKELCCDDVPVPRASSDYGECCDIYAYNVNTEVCCEGYVNKGWGNPRIDTGCCKDYSYDKRCYECIRGRIRPLFDPECQICCDGVIHNMTIGLSCCCGEEMFKPDDQICCDGVLRNRRGDERAHMCCECGSALVDIGIVMDSSESIGLDNWELLKKFLVKLISNADVDSGATRFGLVTYRHNVTFEFALNRYLRTENMVNYVKELRYVRGSTNTGGGIEMMREQLFTKKTGDRKDVPNIALVITDGKSDYEAYTVEQADEAKDADIHMYAIGVGLDQTQELKEIASEPWQENVFVSATFEDLDRLEARIFDVISDVCPQEPKKKLKKPCGDDGKLYDPSFEVCCEGNPQPMYDNENNTECCGELSINLQTQLCCKGEVNEKPHPTRSVCCEEVAYDPKKAICCYETTVVPKENSDATECCGMESYSTKRQICCEDILYENYGEDGCCGACCELMSGKTVSYDTRCYKCENGELLPLYDCAFQRCCDGVIQEIYSQWSCCCGKNAFDPADQICCDRQLRKRQPDDDKQCCECAKNILDIGIVLDSSESVGLDNWKLMELFVEDLIKESTLPNVRFGLVMYRHNVTLRFNLNTFFNKSALLAAVDTLPYIRGSTNTGLGLETMRKEIFNKKRGDRNIAPNFALLVTDGDSDDYAYTVQQADLAKQEGIHIVALGVGLKNVTELQAVASPPAEENAISLRDFDDLKKVKDRIFGELSAKVCPQLPEERCETPCGNLTYDEKIEICCHEIPQPLYAGMATLCCDTVAYDPDCFMCCEDFTLVSRYAKEFTECCCHFAYDSRSHHCCGNQILPLVAGEFTACCHNESYDIRSQVCCDYINPQPMYGGFEYNTGCCGGISYDMRCYECKRNETIVEIYNTDTQLCCDGEIQDKMYGDRSCCCGQSQFDVETHICCSENLIERPNGIEVVCCADRIHNPKKEICCEDRVRDRMNGFETCCCGNQAYHPDEQHCCLDKLSKKDSPKDDCCCNDEVYNVNEELCCDGAIQPFSEAGNRKSTICCGKNAYDPRTHTCCDKKVYELFEDAPTICCGNKAYNGDVSVCVDDKVRPLMRTCNNRQYDPSRQLCCNGWINNVTTNNDNIRCCHDRAYDTRKQVCCCNGFLQEAFAGIYTQCCYSFGYDSRTHICCDGQVTRKRAPSTRCCCERSSYDSEREICCKGKVKSRCVGLFTKCCDTEAYDPGYKICCDGKLYNRVYGHDTYCCGDEIYTPTLAACCGKRIAYRRALKLVW